MSSVLDLDIGNTRTKWRCGQETGALRSPKLPPIERPVNRVRVSTVLASHSEIGDTILEMYGVTPEFAKTGARLAGVTNGYTTPQQMGVDRWLAIVAAWDRVRQPCVVVDAGTALTVDVVGFDGLHQGGYIVPGLNTMREALWNTTDGVHVEGTSSLSIKPVLGTNTQQAVLHGTHRMVLDLVSGTIDRLHAQTNSSPEAIVTGGNGEYLAGSLSKTCQLIPDLVLDGLTIALP